MADSPQYGKTWWKKLSPKEKADALEKDFAAGKSNLAIAEKFHISQGAVAGYRDGRNHLLYPERYASGTKRGSKYRHEEPPDKKPETAPVPETPPEPPPSVKPAKATHRSFGSSGRPVVPPKPKEAESQDLSVRKPAKPLSSAEERSASLTNTESKEEASAIRFLERELYKD